MGVGKTPFAHAMALLPWTSFTHTAKRDSDNADVRRNGA